MSKVKYRYNPETLSYDKIERGYKYYLKQSVFYLSFTFVVSLIVYFIYPYVFESPIEKRQKREIQLV